MGLTFLGVCSIKTQSRGIGYRSYLKFSGVQSVGYFSIRETFWNTFWVGFKDYVSKTTIKISQHSTDCGEIGEISRKKNKVHYI